MATKPIKFLELHYTMTQVLINTYMYMYMYILTLRTVLQSRKLSRITGSDFSIHPLSFGGISLMTFHADRKSLSMSLVLWKVNYVLGKI